MRITESLLVENARRYYQEVCSDCEAYGLKKHGLTRSDCTSLEWVISIYLKEIYFQYNKKNCMQCCAYVCVFVGIFIYLLYIIVYLINIPYSPHQNLSSSEWRMKSSLTSSLLFISIQFNDIVNNLSLVRRAPGGLTRFGDFFHKARDSNKGLYLFCH